MADITLLELHPQGNVQVGPKSLRGSESETTTAETTATAEPTDEGGRSMLSLLVGIAFVLVLGFAAMKILSEEPDEELADLDEE